MDEQRIMTRRAALGTVCLSVFAGTFYSIEKSKDNRKDEFNKSSAELSYCLDKVSEVLSKNLNVNPVLSGPDHKNLNIELNYALKKIRECVLYSNLIYRDLKNSDFTASHSYDSNLSKISEKPCYLEPEETPTETAKYQYLYQGLKELDYNKILKTPVTPEDSDDQCMKKILASSEILSKTYTMLSGLRIITY